MKRFWFLRSAVLLLLGLWALSCTDLTEKPKSVVTADNFYQTEAELISAVTPVYASLRDFSWGDPMFLQEVASDELVIPQRGGDWGDGDIWKDLHRHTWKPTLGFVNGAWASLYRGIARANSVIPNLENAGTDLAKTFVAEVRVLRAYFYWWLMDLYGGVPIVTDPVTDPNNPPKQNTREEVFNFVVNELNEAIPDLEESFGSGNWGRVTKWAAYAILSQVYLNAEVYTGTAHWQDCVDACDAIINSGQFEMLDNYFDVFDLNNEGPGNRELIWVVGHKASEGVGFFRHMATLHYNQLPQTPWNGFSVLADFYYKYDSTDVRRQQFLVGPQVWLAGPKAGQPTTDRQGNPLIFTVEIQDIENATEGEGARVLKWPVDPNMTGGNAGNDFAIFRYPVILLTKAEALFMLGDVGGALDLVNQVRARAFEPDKPLTSLTRDDILNERGFELFWENFRRQDLIRTGHWGDPWTFKDPSPDFRQLYPIPQIQLDANPNLKQNPGY